MIIKDQLISLSLPASLQKSMPYTIEKNRKNSFWFSFPHLSLCFALVFCVSFLFAGLTAANAQVNVIPFKEDLAKDTLVKHLVKIDKIFIKGNKKTKGYIIKRELSLEEGEVVAFEDLERILKEDRRKINNTRLFLQVEITAMPLSDRLYDLVIDVKERWYIVASPIFKLADRNFNDWWANQERDISRVNFGGKFTHYNFRGRGEKLALLAQFGYTRSFKGSYTIPYIDPTRKNGLGFSFVYAENTNIALRTTGHKREFFGEDRPLREIYAAGVTFSRRASFYNTHTAALSFYSNHLADTVLQLNPDYYLTGSNFLRYFNLSYNFRRDLRDSHAYPLRGFMINGYVNKMGLGIFNDINLFSAEATYRQYVPLGQKFFFSNAFTGRMSTPQFQPYELLSGLGYGGYIRGYELYVIEGQHHLLNKSELKYQLLQKEFSLGKFMPLDQFRYASIAIYPKVFFDAGYVVMPIPYPTNEILTNKPIWGAGFGLDVISFYDFVFRTEVSFNSLGERGFFLDFAAGI